MSEIDEIIAASGDRILPIYVLWGEEFLVRKAADELIGRLLPDASMGLNLAVMDGAGPRELAQELATLPLFPGKKLVLARDPEFLAPKKGRGDGLARAREAWKAGRRKEGARRILGLAARAGWGVEALESANRDAWQDELNVDLADADVAFLAEVAAFCREEKVSAPEGDAGALVSLIRGGLPPGHALVIAASDVDGRNPLVKLAGDVGCVIERKVGGRLKELEIGDVVSEVLKPFGKRLGPGAEDMLKDRCGGNMRLLQSELEKLALYAEGQSIRAEDVELLVSRARDEEYMELADALQKRDLRAALQYTADAMEQGKAPLMLLGAVASIVRAMIENGERARRHGADSKRMSFNEFKAEVFPAIEKELKAAKERVPHPYAAYAGMQAAGRYGRKTLLAGLSACADADVAIKSSANERLVIERLLWGLCVSSPSTPASVR